MKLIVNGIERDLAPNLTVDAMLDSLGVRPEGVAVAVNYECITRSAFSTTALAEGDEVEILSPHQGG